MNGGIFRLFKINKISINKHQAISPVLYMTAHCCKEEKIKAVACVIS